MNDVFLACQLDNAKYVLWYIENLKNHELSLNQFEMGKYLETYFAGRQTNEMEIDTLPVLPIENSSSLMTWNIMSHDFLLVPWAIEPNVVFVSARVCARYTFLFHIGLNC